MDVPGPDCTEQVIECLNEEERKSDVVSFFSRLVDDSHPRLLRMLYGTDYSQLNRYVSSISDYESVAARPWIEGASEFADEQDHPYTGAEHVFWSMAETPPEPLREWFSNQDITARDVKRSINRTLFPDI
ncbi:MAG: hypothetical protein ABEJ65_01905 [bacterium]